MDQVALIHGCLKGSLRHQRELYQRYAPLMMGICMRYAGSEAEAEDILQEGFVLVFRKLDTFDGRGELGAWMRKIMINSALMHFRKNKKHQHHLQLSEVGYYLESEENLFDQVSAKDLMVMIRELPTGCRMVFNLYAVEGFNHREIGEKLEISTGTSKSQYSRARQLLKERILQEERRVGERAS